LKVSIPDVMGNTAEYRAAQQRVEHQQSVSIPDVMGNTAESNASNLPKIVFLLFQSPM